MSAPKPSEVNPYAAPHANDPSPAPRVSRDEELRHEYLGAILLASVCGGMAGVMYVASHRWPSSDFGEAVSLLARCVSFVLAIASLMYVLITFKAAASRVLLLVGRIRKRKR